MNENHDRKDRELLEALETLNSRRTLELVQRTRRNVMDTAHRMQMERARNRQRLGIALLVLGVFLLLATPVLWSFSEAAFGSYAITETSILTLTVFVVMLSTVMGALLSRGRRRAS